MVPGIRIVSVLFTFPGQGAQRAGMLHALPDHPEVTRTLREAHSALGIDPLALDTDHALASTFAVQLCLLIAGVAFARTLAAHDSQPDVAAGLSIGAYPAAVCVGALDFGDAIRLVARRAHLMETAYPHGYGMAAIIGLNRYQLAPLIAQVHGPATPVYLANLNGPRQLVVAGSDAALQALMQCALQAGASGAELLAVRVPSHCALFNAAADDMREAVAAVNILRPRLIYLSAADARVLSDPARIAEDLACNMARQVHWHECILLAWERGARLALEMPSGSVLTRLTAPVFDPGRALCSDNNRIDSLVALIVRERGIK
jgi:malonate decarboxylase epsilon subunit